MATDILLLNNYEVVNIFEFKDIPEKALFVEIMPYDGKLDSMQIRYKRNSQESVTVWTSKQKAMHCTPDRCHEICGCCQCCRRYQYAKEKIDSAYIERWLASLPAPQTEAAPSRT